MKHTLTQLLVLLLFAAGCHMDIPGKPVADFSFNPTAGCQAPCSVTFTSTSQNAASLQWDFNDGSPKETGATVTHEFKNGREFHVKLIAKSNDGGGNHGVTKIVNITTAPSAVPVADFSYTITNDSIAPATVSFENMSKDANRYEWNFDDPAYTTGNPNTSQEQNPSHTYINAGRYDVTLIAYNGDKPSVTFKKTIEVKLSVTSAPAFSISGDNNFPTDIVSDAGGNIYVSGTFKGFANFGNGNIVPSSRNGSTDFFVAKYNANWQCLWLYTDGSTSEDHANDLTLDNAGNIYLTGSVSGSIAGGGVTPRGGADGFVIKLNTFTGKRQWISTFGGPLEDQGRALAFHQTTAGPRVYLGATVVGDGKTSNIQFNETKYVAVAKDFCFAYINPVNGQITKSVLVTNPGDQTIEALAVDQNGNVYMSGAFDTGITFPSVKPAITSLGLADAYIAKWSLSTEQFEWAKQIGSVLDDFGYDLAIDLQNSVYVTGMSKGFIRELNVGSTGDYNVYVGKWNATGSAAVGKNGFSEGEHDYTGGIVFTPRGTILVSGSYSKKGRFPFTSNVTVESSGETDVLITELDPNDLNPTGNFMVTAGGPGEDRAVKLCAAPDGYVYSVGKFAGTSTYNGRILMGNTTSPATYNTYIVRYKL